MTTDSTHLILNAIQYRSSHLRSPFTEAFRLFNGFYEGDARLVLDLYGKTLVIFNYAEIPSEADPIVKELVSILPEKLPFLESILVKVRNSSSQTEQQGKLHYGTKLQTRIIEHDIRYSINLTLNQDASFYLDTIHLRKWLFNQMQGKTVLNTFAYTGSLGVAACAGRAKEVVQTDIERTFLHVAKTSFTLNGFPIEKKNFISGDFFKIINRFKREQRRFDCIILDPPFFSVTDAGRVDLLNESKRLINKVRPLINNNGWLVAINNALFLSGESYHQQLEQLCADGYLAIEALIPVPETITGYSDTIKTLPPISPSPFNHSTKIAVLRVKRKP
ncbi:MAG: class I SAM-dependent methyltransferase [Anaerolineaceae bacterium]|nr:class I SAM-dependent methyltransferase [Anaerolineaceae bacterium]